MKRKTRRKIKRSSRRRREPEPLKGPWLEIGNERFDGKSWKYVLYRVGKERSGPDEGEYHQDYGVVVEYQRRGRGWRSCYLHIGVVTQIRRRWGTDKTTYRCGDVERAGCVAAANALRKTKAAAMRDLERARRADKKARKIEEAVADLGVNLKALRRFKIDTTAIDVTISRLEERHLEAEDRRNEIWQAHGILTEVLRRRRR